MRNSAIQISLISNDTADFYRFLYDRKNGSEKYEYVMSNVVTRRLNLDKNVFSSINELSNNSLQNYLNKISGDEQNITEDDIRLLHDEIMTFKNNDNYRYLEIILPQANNNEYNQNDIDAIYEEVYNCI